jgi:threonine dehydrogenase-like Zn-dependent dehydrogenase
MYGIGDVRVETVPDARVIEPTDALVTVTRACICGSDLWPYKTMEHSDNGRVMGHEVMGIVEAVGADPSFFSHSFRALTSRLEYRADSENNNVCY